MSFNIPAAASAALLPWLADFEENVASLKLVANADVMFINAADGRVSPKAPGCTDMCTVSCQAGKWSLLYRVFLATVNGEVGLFVAADAGSIDTGPATVCLKPVTQGFSAARVKVGSP